MRWREINQAKHREARKIQAYASFVTQLALRDHATSTGELFTLAEICATFALDLAMPKGGPNLYRSACLLNPLWSHPCFTPDHGPQIFGPIERKMLRALQARATFFAFSPQGPGGAHGAPAQGPIERKMLRALQARATFFAISPPGAPGGGAHGAPGPPKGIPKRHKLTQIDTNSDTN